MLLLVCQGDGWNSTSGYLREARFSSGAAAAELSLVEPRCHVRSLDGHRSLAVDRTGTKHIEVDCRLEERDVAEVGMCGPFDDKVQPWTAQVVVERRPLRTVGAPLRLVADHEEGAIETGGHKVAVKGDTHVDAPVLLHGRDQRRTAQRVGILADSCSERPLHSVRFRVQHVEDLHGMVMFLLMSRTAETLHEHRRRNAREATVACQ